jgi:hypothetical protein
MSLSALCSWLGSSIVSTASQEGTLAELIEVLQQIDTSSPDTEANEVSIDDNNGERIIM